MKKLTAVVVGFTLCIIAGQAFGLQLTSDISHKDNIKAVDINARFTVPTYADIHPWQQIDRLVQGASVSLLDLFRCHPAGNADRLHHWLLTGKHHFAEVIKVLFRGADRSAGEQAAATR